MNTVRHRHSPDRYFPLGYRFGEKPDLTIPAGLRAVAAGHRPPALGGYKPQVWNQLVELATRAIHETRPSTVLSGLAPGWEQAVAFAALKAGIDVIAVLAFEGQDRRWPERSRRFYNEILGQCIVRQYHHGGFSRLKVASRNRALAQEGDLVLALWNGGISAAGSLIHSCRQEDCRIVNFWRYWRRPGG